MPSLNVIRHLLDQCTFPGPGEMVTCAVSGGADSLALLALAVAAGCRATALHVDHGLRPGSASEADLVAHTARELGAEFRAESVVVDDGPNLEARARAARYKVMPADVLTGHTADDQAETVLVNVLRGAGLDGLAGMRPARHPILQLRRTDTVWVCETLGLVPFMDPSNRDPRHLRNRIRHEVLPLVDTVAGRDVASVLARQAHLLRDDADLLNALAADIDVHDAPQLACAPAALARRAVRRWLSQLAGGTERHPPNARSVERVLAVARNEATACEIEGGWRISRHQQRLVASPPSRATEPSSDLPQ